VKILIAEDDKEMFSSLEKALDKRGHTVEGAPDGAAALEKALVFQPDVIISDIMMPVMDGFMLCRKIKNDPRLKNIRVVLYTATPSEKDEEELARSLGASRLVTKLDGMEPLLEAVTAEVEGGAFPAAPDGTVPAGEVDAEYVRVLSRKLQLKDAQLRGERDLAKMYLDVAGVLLMALDRGGRITLINKKGSAILGYEEDALMGEKWFDTCLPPESRDASREGFKKLMEGGSGDGEYFEKKVLTKAGETRVLIFHRAVIREGAAITGVLYSGSDMTDQRRVEEALFQAQKMDSIGQLSAGMAHDLNNLLGPVLAYADFLRKSLPPEDPRQSDINEISNAANRSASLLQQLLAFSRRQVLDSRVLDLNAIIGGLGGMLQRIIGEHIRIVYSLDPSAGLVKADPVRMEQVIINLAVNARDAMEHGGTLKITTGALDLERSGEMPAGRYFLLTVADTGCGMDAGTVKRIFEPFFTTKGRGRGMGLGLSTAYGIIKQSGGDIRVESGPGEGSVFSIYLPLTSAEALQPSAGTAAPEKGVVLLAEDDESMRRVTKRILGSDGYEVLEAVNGKEALRLLEKSSGAVSLLLTDVVMPELDGIGLALEVILKYPAIRILCMSGYADRQEDLEKMLGTKASYVQKPFAPEVLLKKIGDILAGRDAGGEK